MQGSKEETRNIFNKQIMKQYFVPGPFVMEDKHLENTTVPIHKSQIMNWNIAFKKIRQTYKTKEYLD